MIECSNDAFHDVCYGVGKWCVCRAEPGNITNYLARQPLAVKARRISVRPNLRCEILDQNVTFYRHEIFGNLQFWDPPKVAEILVKFFILPSN